MTGDWPPYRAVYGTSVTSVERIRWHIKTLSCTQIHHTNLPSYKIHQRQSTMPTVTSSKNPSTSLCIEPCYSSARGGVSTHCNKVPGDGIARVCVLLAPTSDMDMARWIFMVQWFPGGVLFLLECFGVYLSFIFASRAEINMNANTTKQEWLEWPYQKFLLSEVSPIYENTGFNYHVYFAKKKSVGIAIMSPDTVDRNSP